MRIASRPRLLSYTHILKLYFRLIIRKIASRNLVSLLLAGAHSALVAFQFKYRLDWVLWSIACHSVYHAHSANPAHDRICGKPRRTERCSFVSDFCQEARRLTLLPDSPFPILSLFLYFPPFGRIVRRQPQEGSETRTRLYARRNRKRLRFPLFASGPRALA